MYTLRFDNNDLAYNRRGYLSEPQRRLVELNVATLHVQARQGLTWFAGLCAAIFGAGALVEFGQSGWDVARLPPGFGEGMWIAAGLLLLLLGMAATSAAWTTWGYRRGSIRRVEGVARVVDREIWSRGPTPIHNLVLRRRVLPDFTFRFQDSESLGYFRDGARYRIYYLPAAIPIALSAEELDR